MNYGQEEFNTERDKVKNPGQATGQAAGGLKK